MKGDVMLLATLLTPDFSFRLLLTLAHFFWQGAAIGLLAFLLLQFLRNASAQIRCHILTLSLLAMAAAPIFTFMLLAPTDAKTSNQPSQPPPQPLRSSTASLPDTASPPILPLIAPTPPIAPQSSAPIPSPIDWRTRLHNFSQPLALLYLFIVLLMLARILLGLHATHRLSRHCQPVEPQILAALSRQMSLLGLTLQPALAYCTHITTPILIGLFRPTILLPLSLTSTLSIQQIESILAHELAHIRRLDPIFILVQRVVEALLFFHPLVWLISRRLDIERERACDQLVLKAGHNHLDYASALIELGQSALNTNLLPTHLAAASNPSQLRSRILSLLGHPPRQTVRLTLRSSLLLLAVAIVSCIFLPRLWAQSQPAKPATQPALLTKEELLQRITDLRSRVKDLSVSTTDVVVKGPPNIVQQSRRTIVLKRDMMYVDQVYGIGQNGPFHRQLSFDGQQTTQSGGLDGEAMISKGRSRWLDTQVVGFFTVNLLNPPGHGTNRSLLGALQHVPCTIRKDIELIDGHPCEVVEFAQKFNDKLNVWLDLERGLLPIRHRQFRPDGQLWFECNIEKAVEVEKGLWFATRAKTTTFPVFKDMPQLKEAMEQVIIVDSGPNGALIQVNTDPDDSIFDLVSHLPFGTKVFNIDDRKEWRVVGFSKDKKPATRTTAPAQGPATPLTVAPVITPDRKVEFDLKPWGEAVAGVQIRFRLSKENSPLHPYLDIKNSSQQNLKYDLGRPRVEFDQKWYTRENEQERLIDLYSGRTYNATGPIFLGDKWFGEQDHQPLRKTPGKHTIRVKIIAKAADGKGEPIEIITAPLTIDFDARGLATTEPTQ
ncbi:MAG TPA: M56 family metallopeptidase, partial [Tepidisphaeraceae bacterium]|nr:M56 family metallopeptidase [Tepidisphaeraceae bacterium]